MVCGFVLLTDCLKFGSFGGLWFVQFGFHVVFDVWIGKSEFLTVWIFGVDCLFKFGNLGILMGFVFAFVFALFRIGLVV